MYGKIADALQVRPRVFLVVPEQYTLEGERDAFRYLRRPGFIDFDVLSMTSLARRVLSETGTGTGTGTGTVSGVDTGAGVDTGTGAGTGAGAGGRIEHISRYGKFMLLSRLLYRHKKTLEALTDLEGSAEFVSKLSDMIAEMKSYGVTPQNLCEIADGIGHDGLLKRKLGDVAQIYKAYEEVTYGRYMETADRIKLFTTKIGEASFIKGSEIWFSGFDYLSPTLKDAVIELSAHAADVNVVLTSDKDSYFFALTNELAEDLKTRANEAGVATSPTAIDKIKYAATRPAEIAYIEQHLFEHKHSGVQKEPLPRCSEPDIQTRGAQNEPPQLRSIRLVCAPNYYAEAEHAAASVKTLVRDEGLRYRDILVLTNDMAERGPIIRRTFARYGLPVFMDQRRSVEHSPVTEFILALTEIAANGRQYEDVFRMLKTGLSGLSRPDIEELENYVIRYGIRGKRWEREFSLGLSAAPGELAPGAPEPGAAEPDKAEQGAPALKGQTREAAHKSGSYTRAELDALDAARARAAQLMTSFEKGFKSAKAKTAGERTEALIKFLKEDARLPEQIADYAKQLEDAKQLEYAGEMRGIESVVFDVLEQMKTVLGDLVMPMKEYATVLRTGFESIKLGVLPPASDQITIGTMQRTRAGAAKAVFVIGANDGILPAEGGDDKMLTYDEMHRLMQSGFELGKSDDAARLEEQLAIYRNLSKPTRLLYVSYSAANESGGDIRPSQIFTMLRKMFPEVPVETDLSGMDPYAAIQHPDEALEHLARRLRAERQGEEMPEIWSDVYRWYLAEQPEDLSRLTAGLSFKNRREHIDEAFVSGLVTKTVSPSQLERFSRCSFEWFMDYGLRLKERRAVGQDSRDVGNVYHNVLKRFGEEMSKDGLPAYDERSKWNTATDREIVCLIEKYCAEEYIKQNEDAAPPAIPVKRVIPGEDADPAGTADRAIPANSADPVDPADPADRACEVYRQSRISTTMSEAALALTHQIRSGRVEKMHFEADFGFGKEDMFPPIRPGDVTIRGRIDRVDVLEGGYARIIDYKSGSDKFSLADVQSGWQLQLMIYMQAVANRFEPAGVFYFKIAEPHINDDIPAVDSEEYAEELKAKIQDSFTPDGLTIDDDQITKLLGEGMTGKTKKSAIEPGEFAALRTDTESLIEDLCTRLASGTVTADPMKAAAIKTAGNTQMTACTYCQYKSLCNYDPAF
jgi:ATP-dependent helicase/nuclease subunit B